MELFYKSTSPLILVKIVWPIILLFFLVFWVILQTDIEKGSVQFFKPDFFTSETLSPSLASEFFLVNTKGCRIQMMDAFDKSIQAYLVNRNKTRKSLDELPIRCAPLGLPPLVSSNLTHLFTDESSIALHNLTQLHCCYQPFWRKPLNNTSTKVGQIDNEFVSSDKCIDFTSAVHIGDNEFVKVQCTSYNKSRIIYTDFHSFTPIKRKKSRSETQPRNSDRKKASVLILGVDAVSRLNLIRQMPKTVDYMKNVLHGVEMLGYNKVGDNTFPNLVPVLVGVTVEELESVCWPKKKTYFDDCPFLWKNFSQAGYTTCYAEDASWMGIFNYLKKGFFYQPTDYYWGMYNRRVEAEIGKDKRLNANLCCGYRMTIDTLLNYGKKFALTMSDQPFFSFIWGTSLSHDFLNLPMYGDDLHKDFLSELHDKGVFDNTILVFMSDHGIRWGGIRSTYQGYLEERLPFLYFVFPRWFRKKYATAIGNLRQNSRKLTTPFDLHKTLSDLLNLQNLDSKTLKKRIANGETRKGISLFLPIPETRTCTDAGIPNNWCTCHQIYKVPENDSAVANAAENLVDHINFLLIREKRCAQLQLKRILSARVAQTVPENELEQMKKTTWVRDYIMTIETNPGEGHFEATVRYKEDKSYKTIGSVSRTNTYGNQSSCISDYKLRLYCFCISLQ